MSAGFEDVIPQDSPIDDANRPRRRKRASVLVASGVVLVILMVVLGEMLSRDETTADSPVAGQNSTSETATPPSTTAAATDPSASSRNTPEDDLGIAGVPISVLPCDGRWITNIGSAYSSDTSTNKEQVADLLTEFPGSAYLLADTGCYSQLPGGTHARNYRVFLGPFDSEREACDARPPSVSGAWVKPLDDATDPQKEHCLGDLYGE